MRVISPSRKFLLRISVALTGLVLVMVVLLLVISLTYGDKVKELVVNEINSRLLVPVEVGQVDFTLFKSFPDASIVFRNVAMKSPAGLNEAPGLLHAKSVSLRIGLFSLITGNYKIKSLVIDEASVTLWVGTGGRDNFHILKQTGNETGSSVNFDMQQVILRKTEIYYRNLVKKTDLALNFPEFFLMGKMTGQRYDLKVSGDFEVKRLLFGAYNYTPASKIGIQGIVKVNEELKICEITEANIQFAGIVAGIRGTFGYGKEQNPIGISIQTSEADISEVLSALPVKLTEPYKNFEPGGKLSLQANVSGNWGKFSSPFIKTEFGLKNGSFTETKSGSKIRNLNLTGVYTSTRGKNPESLGLKSFSGETRNGRFKGALKIADFKKPLLNLNLSADINLSELEGIIKAGGAHHLSGKFIADINYRGAYKAGEQMAVQANGLVRLNGVGFTYGKESIEVKNINGQFELKNGRIYVDGFNALIGETDLKLNGYFDNLLGYLLFTDQPMHFDAQFSSGKFRLEDIMALSGSDSDTTGRNSIFPKGLGFEAGFSIGKFSYRKFTASGATGRLSLNNNILRAGDLAFNAVDGKVTATGLLNGRYGDHAQVVCNAKLTNVDIPRLFYEFNDFGQTSLQSKHLRGRGDATVQYSSVLDNNFITDEASVTAVADIEIRNGEMIQFEPFQEMSRFLNEDELKNVKFSTMHNRIEIVRKMVVIPEMEIQTSALNVKGYGSHTFGNEIDYHFSVLTSELRKNKRKKTPPPTAVEDDGLGRTRLFLHMTGTVDEPVIKYDHKAVAKKIANDFKGEKQVLRNVIRKEFGKNKAIEEPGKVKSSTQFEIEWDEDK